MGDNPKAIREPKQKRSMQKKQLIIDTAKDLFCANGYYNTTTNEIAKKAGLSIGTLYSYFADKETILLDLLDQYNAYFYKAFEFIDTEENANLFKNDIRQWFRELVENLIRIHKPQVAFHRELEVLYYSTPEVTAIMDAQTERIRLATLHIMKNYKDSFEYNIICDDIEAASVIAVDFINSIVDRVVFKNCVVEKDRIISAGIETIYRIFSNK